MDWSKGYSATYYAKRVDPKTWRDIETIKITGGSIKRNLTGLREAADIDCAGYAVRVEQWIRVYMDVEQDGEAVHVPLFTGLATSPDRAFSGRIQSNSLECYSVLKAADDIKLMRGWYAPSNALGGEIIRQLLSATPAPVTVVEGSPTLKEPIIAENNESHLTMVDKILAAIDWRIRISGDGRISIEPKALESSAQFDPQGNDVIETEINMSADLFSVPNVLMVVADDLTAIARDENSNSILSIENRGREMWAIEDGVSLADNETIAHYAMRRLKELQQIQQTADYDRRYVPGIVPGDLIRMHYPMHSLDGLYAIESQSIELGYSARTSENISRYIPKIEPVEDVRTAEFFALIDDADAFIVTDTGDMIIGLGA